MINEYFHPVELDKPDIDYLANDNLFCRNITIHTPDHPIKSLQKFDVALIGINQFKKGKNTFSTEAANLIRSKLYELYKIDNKIKIVDLGTLRTGSSSQDIYFGLRDVLIDLHSNQVLPIIFGSSEDISYASLLLYEYLKESFNLTTINQKLCFTGTLPEETQPVNYLDHFLHSPYLFNYSNLAHQACFVSKEQVDLLEDLNFESLRLGSIRYNTFAAEPFLRDARVIGIDINSVKHSDAPGQIMVSPNGLYGEELCQLAKYAGMSDHVCQLFLSGLWPEKDLNSSTAALAAQVLWYFLDGVVNRKNERPSENKKNLKKYIVNHKLLNQVVTFYRSLKSDRWWIEVPHKNNEPILIACSEDDYQAICNEEIPSRWWKVYQKLNKE